MRINMKNASGSANSPYAVSARRWESVIRAALRVERRRPPVPSRFDGCPVLVQHRLHLVGGALYGLIWRCAIQQHFVDGVKYRLTVRRFVDEERRIAVVQRLQERSQLGIPGVLGFLGDGR